MKLQKDGRTLAKEDIYIDLSKLGEKEITKISKIVRLKIKKINKYPFLIWFWNDWHCCASGHISDKVEITYPDFVKLFQKEPEFEGEKQGFKFTDDYLKETLEERGYFVFPKAPEGDFPDMNGFKGALMECSDAGTNFKKHNVYGKLRGGFLTAYGIKQIVRPIQKTTPTVQELWKIAEEAGADLSKFEKPE